MVMATIERIATIICLVVASAVINATIKYKKYNCKKNRTPKKQNRHAAKNPKQNNIGNQ